MNRHVLQKATKAQEGTTGAVLRRRCGCDHDTGGGGTCGVGREKGDHHSPSAIPPLVHEVLASSGRPLDLGARTFMEPRFGRDFSSVRVHSDVRAAESARSLNAHAFTVGREVVFPAGRYAPSSLEGRRLLAHELAHVDGQDPRGVRTVSDPTDASELEADRRADLAMAGGPVPAPRSVRSAAAVHRQGDTAQTAGGNRTPAGTAGTQTGSAPTLPLHPPPILDAHYGYQLFDATLDRTRCLLTLRKKIRFVFPDHPEPNWAPEAIPWPDGRAARWTQDFIRTVTQRWSGKYALVPESPQAGESCRAVQVAVEVVPVSSGEHTLLEVANYPSDTPSPEARVGGGRSRMFSTSIEPQTHERRFTQVAAEHEFGHMLGLPHVNAANCGSNPREPRCYGENAEQMADVMGLGSEVTAADYAPFAAVMGNFGSGAWRVQPASGGGSSALGVLGWIGGLAAGGALIGGLAGGLVGAAIGAGIGALAGLVVGLATS